MKYAPLPPVRQPPGRILVVDDLQSNRDLIQTILTDYGYEVLLARDGEEAMELIHRDPPDLVLSDIRMPNCDGFELCRAVNSEPSTRLIPVVLMTGAAEEADRLTAIEAGAQDFVTKPIVQAELRARMRSLMQLKRFTDDLDSAESVLRSLALMIEARDAYTEGHCARLAKYATELGAVLEVSEDDLLTLGRGGYFHDIGKIALPDSVLLKPGPLLPEEFELMKQHTIVGDRLCGDLRVLHRVRAIVRHHHERLDGSGYPDGLSGDAIPLVAQIIGIVDVYDAMTTTRPYRPALSSEIALAELDKEVARGWRRADLVGAFAAIRHR